MEWLVNDIDELGAGIPLAILTNPLSNLESLLVSRNPVYPFWLTFPPNEIVLLEWKVVTSRESIDGVEGRPIHEPASRLYRSPFPAIFWCNLVPVGCEVFVNPRSAYYVT